MTSKTNEIMESLLTRLENGQIPAAMATIYLTTGSRPMDGWSMTNQMLCLFAGMRDARGYKQWQKVGRQVRKGEKSRTSILVPTFRQKEDSDDVFLAGFVATPVFDIEQTDGDPLPEGETHAELIASLPLIDVAGKWGIEVKPFDGKGMGYNGYFSGAVIGLGVANANTWLHELMHAADKKTGLLQEYGQHWRAETVAQFGASVLAHVIGHPEIADEGKTYEYVQRYAKNAGIGTIQAMRSVLDRVDKAIRVILAELPEN